MLIKNASWIRMKNATSTVVPIFRKTFQCQRPVRQAILEITCAGTYEAELNGRRVGEFILAPGPGWLYSVSKGATTVWEHWDGIKPDGTFWDDDMNSYNHYAYASVADWVFGVACGIKPLAPGFARIRIEPHPDERLNSLSAVLDTVHGRIRSCWKYVEGGIRYEIEVPAEAEIVMGGVSRIVKKGKYIF